EGGRRGGVEDGEVYGRMRDGGALSIVGDTDVALEQIALACGGYSEAHALLKRPLTWEDLTDAGEGIEANHSPLAEERLRDAAYRKMCMNRDEDRVQSGELSTEDYGAAYPETAQEYADEHDAQVRQQEANAEPEIDSAEWTRKFIERRDQQDALIAATKAATERARQLERGGIREWT